jgi:hypothetical protein
MADEINTANSKFDNRRERISLAAEIVMRHDINPLHAAISMRSWADVERHANAIRDRLSSAIFTDQRDNLGDRLAALDVVTEHDGSQWVRHEDIAFLLDAMKVSA